MVGLCLRSDIEKRNRSSVCSWVSMLNPSIAYLLLRIARLQPEDVMCDPMAGVATIAIEAVQAFGKRIGFLLNLIMVDLELFKMFVIDEILKDFAAGV